MLNETAKNILKDEQYFSLLIFKIILSKNFVNLCGSYILVS